MTEQLLCRSAAATSGDGSTTHEAASAWRGDKRVAATWNLESWNGGQPGAGIHKHLALTVWLRRDRTYKSEVESPRPTFKKATTSTRRATQRQIQNQSRSQGYRQPLLKLSPQATPRTSSSLSLSPQDLSPNLHELDSCFK